MKYEQLIEHFGGLSKSARALDTDRRLVFGWKGKRIPSHWQSKIEVETEGALLADGRTREEAKMYAAFLSREAA